MLSRFQLSILCVLFPLLLSADATTTTPNTNGQGSSTQNQGQNQNQTQNQTKYYCPVDKAYKEYKNGNGKLESVPSFADEKTCEQKCLSQSLCQFAGAQSTGSVVAEVAEGTKLDLAKINKELEKFKKITGIKILAGNVEAMSVSDLDGIGIKELFVPVKQADIKKEGYSATKQGNNVDITDMSSGGKVISLTDTKATKQTENGTYTAEHKTRKSKVPMSQEEINKLTQKEKAALEAAYQSALDAYNKGTSTYKPTSAFVKDGPDEQYTLITLENGKLQEQAGWVALATLVGLSVSGSSINYSVDVFAEDGTSKKENIAFTLDSNGYGEYLFAVEGSTKNDIQVGQDKISFISSVHDAKDLNNVFYSVEKNGSEVSGEFSVEILSEVSADHYRCQGNDMLVGDLGQNAFSDEKSRSSQCKVTNSCIGIAPNNNTNNGNCKILSSQVLNPITDVNGKTIYLAKRVTQQCTIITQKQIGCKQYAEETTNNADLSEFMKTIPTIQTNKKNHDFSKATEALGVMAMSENVSHVFGGEHNFCDDGYFKPTAMDYIQMAIKYAMMVIGGGLSGTGSSAGSAYDDVLQSQGFDGALDALQAGAVSTVTSAATQAGKAALKTFGDNLVKKLTGEMVENAVQEMAKNLAIQVAVKVAGKVLQEVCEAKEWSMCAKKDSQRQSAWTTGSTDGILSNEELDGATDEEDKIAMDYANCMSGRFGLTYEAVLAYQMGTREVNELHYSFNVPMIIDGAELQILRMVMENEKAAAADIDLYFFSRYRVEDAGEANGKNAYALYALKGEDALIAAETVCGGPETVNIIREKYGERFLNPKYAPVKEEVEYPPENELKEEEVLPGLTEDSNAPGSDGTNAADMAFQAADMIAGALPFPWNMAASLFVDVLKQFNEVGNTCTDMDFAERRANKDPKNGEEFIRTNKRISLNLCFKTSIEEREKMMGKATLERHHYCCYDQITTRIFAEGMMAQLGKRASKDNCAPLSIEDLEKVSFSKCKAGQKPDKDKCFPSDKFQELTQAYLNGAHIGVEEAVGNIVNSVFNLDEAVD